MTKNFVQNPISPLTRFKIYEIIFKKSHSSKDFQKDQECAQFLKIFNIDFIENLKNNCSIFNNFWNIVGLKQWWKV
jgi:hypothetical protein